MRDVAHLVAEKLSEQMLKQMLNGIEFDGAMLLVTGKERHDE
jgi:hypothetical protein